METPDSILDAAFAIYGSEGLKQLSMRAVARRVGLTATALYRHYRGKDALVDAVAERGFELFGKSLRRPPLPAEPRLRVFGILDRYRAFALKQPDLFRLMFSTPRRGLRRFPADFAAHRSAVFDELRASVQAGQAAGRFRVRGTNALETTLDLWAFAHGLLTLYQAGRFGRDSGAFTRLYRKSVRRFVGGLAP
jgi:AcrR family transcriptional regulator